MNFLPKILRYTLGASHLLPGDRTSFNVPVSFSKAILQVPSSDSIKRNQLYNFSAAFSSKTITLPSCFILSKPLCKIDRIVFEVLIMYSPRFFSLKAICCSNFVRSSSFIDDHSVLRILFSNSSCSRIDLFSSFIDSSRLASSIGSALSSHLQNP